MNIIKAIGNGYSEAYTGKAVNFFTKLPLGEGEISIYPADKAWCIIGDKEVVEAFHKTLHKRDNLDDVTKSIKRHNEKIKTKVMS